MNTSTLIDLPTASATSARQSLGVNLYLIAAAHYLLIRGGEAGHHGLGGIAIAKEIERGDVLWYGYAAVVGIDGGQLLALVILGGNATAAGGKQQRKEQ